VSTLPLAPKNPLPYWEQLKAVANVHTSLEKLRDVGGPVTRTVLAPKWIMPPMVFIFSPQGARDVLSRDANRPQVVERGEQPTFREIRALAGNSLLVALYHEWLPLRRTIAPMFAKHYVPRFAGYFTQVAEEIPRQWRDGATVNLEIECRTLALRALSGSVLGVDLGSQTAEIENALRTAVKWAADRALRPLNLPRWLPTPGQRQARATAASLTELVAGILQACRDDPARDAPLVRSLIAATDPQTGEPLTDRDICNQLLLFLLAGHETTSTALAYTLWALGRQPDLQQRIVDEVGQFGDRPLTPDDVSRLSYTTQVVREALRLCPPVRVMGRMVMADIEVDGYRLSAGTFAVVAAYALHFDPTLWDNPLTFDPDRFSPERSKGRDRWQYLPFGGGPRNCIGDSFAMLEAVLAVATIIRQVEIRSENSDFPITVPLSAIPAAPVPAQIIRR
jgi:cytochrome P450